MAGGRKARDKRENAAAKLKLRQPDRSAPTEQTLLQFADERNLFEQAEQKQRENDRKKRREERRRKAKGSDAEDSEDEDEDEDEDEEETGLSPRAERIMDTVLWSISLGMLHFTLDVLVQHQYAVEIEWPKIVTRAVQAFFVFSLLFYNLHAFTPSSAASSSSPRSPRSPPSSSSSRLLPARYVAPLRQAAFFVASVAAGCYLVHATNRHGYLAVMKRAPPIACLWVWAIIELDLALAVGSLACAGVYMWAMGYTF